MYQILWIIQSKNNTSSLQKYEENLKQQKVSWKKWVFAQVYLTCQVYPLNLAG